MGWKEDVAQRLARGRKAWFKVKSRLMGSKMGKKMQARVVETCVESGLLFDCAVRVWQVREVKKLQTFVDKCYRYVWSKGKRTVCDCGRELAATTLRRHKLEACPLGEAGPSWDEVLLWLWRRKRKKSRLIY